VERPRDDNRMAWVDTLRPCARATIGRARRDHDGRDESRDYMIPASRLPGFPTSRLTGSPSTTRQMAQNYDEWTTKLHRRRIIGAGVLRVASVATDRQRG
jgi:hypothetical protein